MRDCLRLLVRMLDALTAKGYRRLTVLDNNSSYPPLLAFYRRALLPRYPHVRLARLGGNYGHLALWKTKRHLKHRAGWFALTDPDLDLAPLPRRFVAHLIALHGAAALGAATKIGPALRLDRLPRCAARTMAVLRWEQQYWRAPLPPLHARPAALGPPASDGAVASDGGAAPTTMSLPAPALYRATIDTTFALYPPNHTCHARTRNWGKSRTPAHLLAAVRVGAPYAVEHVPWARSEVDEEAAYFMRSKDARIGKWSEEMGSVM